MGLKKYEIITVGSDKRVRARVRQQRKNSI